MTKKVVINKCFGGFGLSYAGTMRYAEIKGMNLYAFSASYKEGIKKFRLLKKNEAEAEEGFIHYLKTPNWEEYEANNEPNELYFHGRDLQRDDPALVQVVEEMGEKCWGRCAKLAIVEIPEDIEFTVENYDGQELVAEKHRTWM